MGGGNTPGNYADFVYRDGTIEKSFRTINVSSDFSPTLDLYFFHQLGNHIVGEKNSKVKFFEEELDIVTNNNLTIF